MRRLERINYLRQQQSSLEAAICYTISILSWISLLCVMLLLSACAELQPTQTAGVGIKDSLKESIAHNQALFSQAKSPPPEVVSNALIPSLSVSMAATKTEDAGTFDIAVKEVNATEFFTGLVEGTKMSIVVSPSVRGTISLDLKDVTIEQVLDVVRDVYGYEHRKTSYGYEILPAGLQTRVFSLDYLNISRSGSSKTAANSGQQITNSGNASSGSTTTRTSSNGNSAGASGAGATIDTTSQTNVWTDLQAALASIVGTEKDGSMVIVNPQTGTVVVKAYPREIAAVERYLDQMQLSLDRQVIIEAKILEVELNDSYKMGIDWQAFGQNGATMTGTNSTALTGTPFASADLATYFSAAFRSASFSGAIRMLQTQGNVQVLSSPRVSTLNNQKAVIKAGKDEFFVTSVSSTSATVAGANPTQDVSLTPFFSGIALDVTPQVSENNIVTLHIHPIISTVEDQVKEITLGKTGTGADAVDNIQKLPLAISSIRESDSVVRARSGQVVVIGGLLKNTTEQDEVSVPVLGDIPALGKLFRRTEQVLKRTEIVILLRPIVVARDTWNQQMQGSLDRFGVLDRGYSDGAKSDFLGNQGELQRNRSLNQRIPSKRGQS